MWNMSNNTLHYGSDLDETQIQENYDYFIEFLKEKFSGERLKGLLEMYEEKNLGLQLAIAPASGKIHFHYAHVGGYIQHIMNVEKASRGAAKLFEALGGNIDFTEEERIFAALHHDLGKLGDETGPYYVPQTDQWFKDKRGEVFKHNPKVQFWEVTDRALYNLQRYGVKITWKETLGMKLADGLYNEAAGFYLKGYNPDQKLRTTLPYIIHTGDFLACQAENCQWQNSK
jgi:hypothetical protein